MTTSSATSSVQTADSVMGAGAGLAAGALERVRGRLGHGLLRARYQLQQAGLFVSGALGVRLWHLLMAPWARLPVAEQVTWQRRFRDLLARDLHNVEAGYYPGELLVQFPFGEYLRCVPTGLAEMPRVLMRQRGRRYAELPEGVDLARYPRYYRRTFHWQSDGWLSRKSARMYDVGVEFLFLGTADVMRRMAIPPVVDATRDLPAPRVLDVACGTGRFLKQLHQALPRARLWGLDLSPWYIQRAREVLADIPDVSLIADNAESMPLKDASFDVVTSIYLFHELPAAVRRRVVSEAFRVLAPGGRFVLVDSVQLGDRSGFEWSITNFPALYHEPYYRHYLKDDLEPLLEAAGFEVERSEVHLVSKVVTARKPEARPQ